MIQRFRTYTENTTKNGSILWMILESMNPYNTTETHKNKPIDDYDDFYCWIPHAGNAECTIHLLMNL